MRAPASVEDFRDAARKRLPPMLFEYLDGGSFAEQLLDRVAAMGGAPDTSMPSHEHPSLNRIFDQLERRKRSDRPSIPLL
ncbi:hypothetical protein CAF53_19590 [Sphingobium sp. LB126]|nr:hypothetical protein CAF53_19590 [Sphingobium sp. LB126]